MRSKTPATSAAFARRLEVIYCDDIRQEVGNKQSLIGVYGGDMIVARLPAVLPRLCVFVTAATPVAEPFETLVLRVMLDDNVLVSTDDLVAANRSAPAGAPESDSAVMAIAVSVVLSPFQVDQPSRLRVTADTEAGELRGRALRIRSTAEPVSAAPRKPTGRKRNKA